MTANIISISRAGRQDFSNQTRPEICLIEGFGVEDARHAGTTVQHLSRIAKNADQPKLSKIHVIRAELHDELNAAGFDIHPGDMGENILTRGLDLLALPQRTLLQICAVAIVEVTGLRNPCSQLERFRPGLLKACLCRTPDGQLLRKAGIMAIVRRGGLVRPGDAIQSEHPQGPHLSLQPV